MCIKNMHKILSSTIKQRGKTEMPAVFQTYSTKKHMNIAMHPFETNWDIVSAIINKK